MNKSAKTNQPSNSDETLVEPEEQKQTSSSEDHLSPATLLNTLDKHQDSSDSHTIEKEGNLISKTEVCPDSGDCLTDSKESDHISELSNNNHIVEEDTDLISHTNHCQEIDEIPAVEEEESLLIQTNNCPTSDNSEIIQKEETSSTDECQDIDNSVPVETEANLTYQTEENSIDKMSADVVSPNPPEDTGNGMDALDSGDELVESKNVWYVIWL